MPTVSAVAPDTSVRALPPSRSGPRRWLDELYPTVADVPLRLGALLWGCLGLAAATVINLLRTGGNGALDTIWIEDSITFLNQAYNDTFLDVILRPESGYYQALPRLMAEIAGAVPVRYGAAALALQAATAWGVVAVIAFVASRPYLPAWWLRLLVAAPVVLIPVGHTQSDNDVATLHFPALYALFWVLMWQPATRFGKVAAVFVAVLAATSSILAAAFIPLALLRLAGVRTWAGRTPAVLYLAGMALQLGGLMLGVSVRTTGPGRHDPVWAAKEFAVTAIPRTIFGEKWLGGPKVDAGGVPTAAYYSITPGQSALIVASLVVLAAAIACGLARLTHPHWPLALVATASSAIVFCGSIMAMGNVQPRYVIAATLLLYAGIVAILRPRWNAGRWQTRSAVPVLAFAALLAVVCATNYRTQNARATSPSWKETVHTAAVYCRQEPTSPYFFYGYEWWSLQIPCDRLRR